MSAQKRAKVTSEEIEFLDLPVGALREIATELHHKDRTSLQFTCRALNLVQTM